MVSPPYDCQFVFVMKLAAVLNDRYGLTFAMSSGFRGSPCCKRMTR